MSEQPYLTAAGAEKLRAELQELKGPRRTELAHRLREAISQGDLSENADYTKAKEDQGFLEGRIQELDYLLANAIIVEDEQIDRDKVSVGAVVTIQEEDFEPEQFKMVGAKEADPRQGMISNESPIGRALMGCKVGDWVEAITPGGTVRMKILKIE